MAATADVVVIGGGVIGASTAFQLATLGVKRVVLCERHFPAAGASGKSGALVRMHYTNEPEARLAHASLPYFSNWNELVGRGDCGFLKTGMARLVTAENEPKLRANVEMLERVGINTRVIGARELAELAPSWHTDDVVAAAWEPDSGCADPVGTTHGLLERAQDLGAEVLTHTEVTGVDVAGGRVTGVQTSGGPISAPTVVMAGGVWTVPLLRDLGVPVNLQPVRIQVALFRRPPSLAGPHPILIDGINELWLRPEGPNWGSTLVGVASRTPLADPDNLDEGVDANYVPRARAGLAKRIPALADAPMRGGWAGAITLTEDGKAILDQHPEIGGLFVFSGDNGSAFKTAPAVGRVLAEWITQGRPSLLDPAPFRMTRFREGVPLYGEHEYGDRDNDYTRAQKLMLG
ncbi:MAG TPA: FAD-dependent oxidoreductase [Chloroflexota bacterium]|nr:FAD-dependent oxidoreductase [Chloroflexota bacterium]